MQHEELTNEDQMELEDQRKDEERQNEEVTEEPERPRTQEMAGEYSSLEEALLAFEAQDPNAEWNVMAIAVDQNAAQCILYHSVSSGMRKKELLPRHHWVIFSTG